MEVSYVFYSDTDRSASVKNALRTCEALSEENNVTYYGSIGDYETLIDDFNIENNFSYIKKSGPSSNIFSETLKRIIFSLKTFLSMRREKSVVYTRDIFYLFMLSLPLMKSISQKKVFYECHDLCDYTWKFPGFMEKRALKRADKILYVSNGVQESLIDNFDVPKNKLILQRNGVSLDRFENTSKSCLTDKNFNIVYSGSNKERKGLNTLSKAFKKINTDEIDVNLYLVGPEDKSLEDKNISVLGWVEEQELSKILNDADLLVHPSKDTYYQRNYTCPMKLFEYMASRNMVIASDLPTTREIAKETVMYFEPDNVKDLTEKINKLINDTDNYRGNTNQAYKLVSNNYTWGIKSYNINRIIRDIR